MNTGENKVGTFRAEVRPLPGSKSHRRAVQHEPPGARRRFKTKKNPRLSAEVLFSTRKTGLKELADDQHIDGRAVRGDLIPGVEVQIRVDAPIRCDVPIHARFEIS